MDPIRRRSIASRLGRAFYLQIVIISLTALLSVFVAGFVLQVGLMRQALATEAAFFWKRHAESPAREAPRTSNLTGYLLPRDLERLPPHWVNLPPGFHREGALEAGALLFISEQGVERLYLRLENSSVVRLSLLFGLLPLAAVLTLLYLSAWLAYRAARRAVSPIITLAQTVDALDLETAQSALPALGADSLAGDEVSRLRAALDALLERIRRLIQRERDFTRDASHELRSPLTVIRLAADALLADASVTPLHQRRAEQIRTATDEMDQLVQTFLLLARDKDRGLPSEPVDVNRMVEDELTRTEPLRQGKPITARLEQDCRLCVEAPALALRVLVGNLIRNASAYTDQGTVLARIETDSVVIEDTGHGIATTDLARLFEPYQRAAAGEGYGVGLSLVKRLADRFGWRLDVLSQPGRGTRFRVGFPPEQVISGALLSREN